MAFAPQVTNVRSFGWEVVALGKAVWYKRQHDSNFARITQMSASVYPSSNYGDESRVNRVPPYMDMRLRVSVFPRS
jgi:hypothetical protein